MYLLTQQALSRDLKINVEELLHGIAKPNEEEDEEMELPSHSNDVPLSRTGSIYVLSAMAASSALFDAPTAAPSFKIVPDFAAILASALGDPATGSTGAEPEPLIDAVLFLGFLGIESGQGMSTNDDTAYNNILQRLSLLSANMPSPALRYHAHVLISSILHAHPSDHFRLAFIRDTLEHCPYENLKASAVGWLKDELVAADKRTQELKDTVAESSIFATPAALITLGPFLCPDPENLMQDQSISDSYATFQAYQAFYLAVLNLIYLLLSSPSFLSKLQIATVVQEWRLAHILSSLLGAANEFRNYIDKGRLGYGDNEAKGAGMVSMDLVIMAISEVREAVEIAGIQL